MLQDNQNTRLLEYLRKFQPMIFKAVRFKHPEIIEQVYGYGGMNAIGDFSFSSIFDTVKSVTSQIVPTINAYNVIKSQIQRAINTPINQIQSTPPVVYKQVPVVIPAPVAKQVANVSTTVPNAPEYHEFPKVAIFGGVALLVIGAFLLLRRK